MFWFGASGVLDCILWFPFISRTLEQARDKISSSLGLTQTVAVTEIRITQSIAPLSIVSSSYEPTHSTPSNADDSRNTYGSFFDNDQNDNGVI